MENPFKRRRHFDKEAGVFEDDTFVRRLGLTSMKEQLDQHSRPLTERIETLADHGVTAIEAAAGAVAVLGAVGSVVAWRVSRA